MNSLSAVAQESRNGYFAGMGVGTQALDYKGTNVSFEAGRRLGNFEMGAGFTYYYNPRAFSSIRGESFRGSWEHCKTYSAYLFAGYDFLALAKHCDRHHLTPRVGLGYAHIDTNGFSIKADHTELYGWEDQGLEVALSLKYLCDVNGRLALGAYVEYDIRVREQTLIGTLLRVKF